MNEATLTDKNAFEDLIDMLNKRDEEAFCLMRYTRQDDIRIKELTAELARYSERSINLKRTTEEELIEYSTMEIELDKIADQFRRSHHQRQQLIKRWETILEQMQRKDYNIDTLAMVNQLNS
jgi:UDP-glucose:O-linked fucose beta-1,3-glucosyltransferase